MVLVPTKMREGHFILHGSSRKEGAPVSLALPPDLLEPLLATPVKGSKRVGSHLTTRTPENSSA
jgi:hypothetical protein